MRPNISTKTHSSFERHASPKVFTKSWYDDLQETMIKKRFKTPENSVMPTCFVIQDHSHTSLFPPKAESSEEADLLYQILAFVEDISNDLLLLRRTECDLGKTYRTYHEDNDILPFWQCRTNHEEKNIPVVWKKIRGISEMLETRYDLLQLRKRSHMMRAKLLDDFGVPAKGDNALAKSVFEQIQKTNPESQPGSFINIDESQKPLPRTTENPVSTLPKELQLPNPPAVTTLTAIGNTIYFTYVLENHQMCNPQFIRCPSWSGFKWSHKVSKNVNNSYTLLVLLMCHGPEKGELQNVQWRVTARFGTCAVSVNSAIFANVLHGARDPGLALKAINEMMEMVENGQGCTRKMYVQYCPSGVHTFVSDSLDHPRLATINVSSALHSHEGKVLMLGYISVFDEDKK